MERNVGRFKILAGALQPVIAFLCNCIDHQAEKVELPPRPPLQSLSGH